MKKLIQKIFIDILKMYKNFLHWNIMKLFFMIYSFCIAIVMALPFLIILFIYLFVSDIQWMNILGIFWGGSLGLEEISNISENLISFIFGVFLILSVSGVLFMGYSYSKIFLNILNLQYLKGKKVKYFEKSYFDIYKILKFFKISLWKMLILSIPVVVFTLGMILFTLSIGTQEQLSAVMSSSVLNYYSVISLLFLVVCSGIFVFLALRMFFSNIIFAEDKKNEESALSYIKKSFRFTQGYKKIALFLGVFVLVGVVIIPVSLTGKYIENTKNEMNDYQTFVGETDFELKEQMKSEKPLYFEKLVLEYSNKDNLDKSILIYDIYMVLFNVFSFLFVFGIIEMASVSFYKRVV